MAFVLFSGTNVSFALFLAVENMFISYLLILSNFLNAEYVIKNNQYYLINNLCITIRGLALA